MSDVFNQIEIDSLNQSIRGKRIKVEILDNRYKILDSIEGECESGNINIDANSDNRRSFDLTIAVSSQYTDIITSKYIVDKNSYIWIDKYVKIYIGIDDLSTNETVWFNKGIYLIDNPSYNYSMEDSRLNITGLDLISNLTDQRKGQLTNYQTKIYAYEEVDGNIVNTKIKDAIINILKDFAYINDYYIEEPESGNQYLPEDVTFEAGSTIYDILSKLIEYLPGWEMYFDEDGVFRIQSIPDGENDTIFPLDENNTSVETVQVDFNNVKNVVIVRGRTHDADYFVDSTNVSYTDNTLILNIEGLTYSALENNVTIGFVWLDEYNPILNKLKINDIADDFDLMDFEGRTSQIKSKTFQPNSIIILRYRNFYDGYENQEYFDFLSNDQAEGYAVNEEKESPYYINAEINGENYYCGMTECSNHINYIATLNNEEQLNSLNNGTQITLMPNTINDTNSTLTILDGVTRTPLVTNVPIYDNTTGQRLEAKKWDGDYTIYKLTYDGNNFNLNSRLQSYNYYLSGGEYDNIYSNSLAIQRARYELYLHSNLNDSVNISTIPNYYMDVNKKIKYKEKSTGIEDYFLTKTISTPLDTTGSVMSIDAIRLYPERYYVTISNAPRTIMTVEKRVDTNTWIELESEDLIKIGDYLRISYTVETYWHANLFINGDEVTIPTGETYYYYIVLGNTSISTSSGQNAHTLYITNDTQYGTLTVTDRNGNILDNGSIVYEGRTINISLNPRREYLDGSVYINGSYYHNKTYLVGNTDVNMEIEYTSIPFSNSTINAILQAEEDGVYKDIYSIGDTIEFGFGSLGKYELRIIDFDHDILASDETKRAPITLELVDLMQGIRSEYYKVLPRRTEGREFSTSYLKQYINNTLLPMFPAVLRNAMKEVKKQTIGWRGYTDFIPMPIISTTYDLVFPLSKTEMIDTGYSYDGTLYEYWRTHPNASDRIKTRNGTPERYWLRGYDGEGDGMFQTMFQPNAVDTSGDFFNDDTEGTLVLYVSFAICI